MIKCVAIDDEPLALKQLEYYLAKVPYFELVASCRSAMEAMRLLDEQAVDVMFIDINMPDLNGLEFVRSLANPPMIVFTTAYQEYALDGYKVNAVDYLLKPFGMSDVLRAAAKVKERYDLMHAASSQSPAATRTEDDGSIFLKVDHKVVRVNIGDIVYVEGCAEYLRIFLRGQSAPLVVYMSMKKMEERLQPHGFMRVHKSYVVALGAITEVGKGRLTLDGEIQIPIGDSYRDGVGEYVAAKLLGK